jgi:hypothetical protein
MNVIISTNNLVNVPAMLETSGNVVNPVRRIGMSILTQKKCTKCGEVKSADKFQKDHRYKSGLFPQCRDCKNSGYRKHYQENREEIKAKKLGEYYADRENILKQRKVNYESDLDLYRHRNRIQNLKQNFGISLEEYQRMFDAQGGVCAICGKPETAKSNRGEVKLLAVDHDHRTGKIRGLLCAKCNTGVGNFDENESLLVKAIRYLIGKK